LSRPALALFNVLFLGFLMAPVVVVVLVAFTPEGWLKIPTTRFSIRWFRAILDHPEFISAFRNSALITYITDPLVAAISATLVFLTIGVVLVLDRLVGLDRLLGTR
jgi:putative spermidine/putrescine transport system permease protein